MDTEGKVKIGTENAEVPFDHGAICIKLDLVKSLNEMHAEPPFPCDYVTSRNGYRKRVMTSTAESKCFFKNHKLYEKWRWTYNVISAFSWSGMCIYIYIYISFKYPVRWQKLLGSARSGSTALSYQNCVITSGWRLMRLGYRMCFHILYDEKNVSLSWLANTMVFIGEHHLWVWFCFSSSGQHVLLILLGWFVRWEASVHTTAILLDVASRICSKQNIEFLYSC